MASHETSLYYASNHYLADQRNQLSSMHKQIFSESHLSRRNKRENLSNSSNSTLIDDLTKTSLFYRHPQPSSPSPKTRKASNSPYFRPATSTTTPGYSLIALQKSIYIDSFAEPSHPLNIATRTASDAFIPFVCERDKLGRLHYNHHHGANNSQDDSLIIATTRSPIN